MATLRQRSTSDLALQKATGPVKSNHQIDSESQAFLPNQSENRLQPNCEGLDKFAMQYFDEEATRGYLQMLHGLIERLTEKSKNSVNRHHVFFLAKTASKSGQALNQMIYGLISRNYKNRMISTL